MNHGNFWGVVACFEVPNMYIPRKEIWMDATYVWPFSKLVLVLYFNGLSIPDIYYQM